MGGGGVHFRLDPNSPTSLYPDILGTGICFGCFCTVDTRETFPMERGKSLEITKEGEEIRVCYVGFLI